MGAIVALKKVFFPFCNINSYFDFELNHTTFGKKYKYFKRESG